MLSGSNSTTPPESTGSFPGGRAGKEIQDPVYSSSHRKTLSLRNQSKEASVTSPMPEHKDRKLKSWHDADSW